MSYLFAFSCCSWGSQGKNTEVVCQSKTSYLLSSLSLFPPPLSLWKPPIFSVSMNIFILDISYTCHHIICDFFCLTSFTHKGFPCDSAGKEFACNAGDLGWEDPWRRKTLPTPVFWPGECHGLYSPWNSPGQNTGVGSLFLLQGSSQPRD